MKQEKILIMFMTVFIVMALAYLFTKDTTFGVSITREAQAKESVFKSSEYTFNTKTTGSMESGDAIVALTPVLVDKNTLLVKFKINTHAVSLSRYDLKEITTLEFNEKVLKPVKASRIGGHHSSGTIVFDSLETIDSFTIRIIGIPRIQDRVYTWNVG